MNRNQLEYFISLGETLSFTKAAEQNFVSQTAITQQIKNLEEHLAVTLVDRSKRPIELTRAGRIFMIEARAILERMDLAVKNTRDADTGLGGTIRIGYTKGYECSNFPHQLKAFHDLYPNIMLICHRHDTDMLAASLLNDEFDIIFTWDSTNILGDSTVNAKLVDRVRLMVALYPSHPLAHRKTLRRSDLKGERLLFMSPSNDGYSMGDSYYVQLYRYAGYDPDIILRTSDMESVIMMIEAQVGISILPEYCTNKRIGSEDIIYIPLEGESEIEEIIAVWKKDNTSPVFSTFTQYVEEKLAL